MDKNVPLSTNGMGDQSARYFRAMVAGQDYICSRIEQDHDLYGYPPEIVSVGLKAFDDGRNVQDAVAEYLNGEPHDHR